MDAAGIQALLAGYFVTVGVETPVLVLGLSRSHPLAARVVAGLWLSACTYPIVAGVIPVLLDPSRNRAAYVAVAELFAPAAECFLFCWAFREEQALLSRRRDLGVIVLANLASFLLGEWLVRPGP